MKHFGKYTTEELQYVLANTREWLDNFHRNNRNAMAYPFILNDKVKEMILEYNPYADLAPFDDGGSWIYDGRTNPKERREAFAAFCMENLPIALNFKDLAFYFRYTLPGKCRIINSIIDKLEEKDKAQLYSRKIPIMDAFGEWDYMTSHFHGTYNELCQLGGLFDEIVETHIKPAESSVD